MCFIFDNIVYIVEEDNFHSIPSIVLLFIFKIIFAYTCHLCHREEIRMGFPTRKRFHRHLRAQHGINNPEDEDNEENREFIKNPTPIVNPVEPDKRNALLSENRKKSGITVKRKRKKKQNSKGDKIFVKKICSKVTISSQNGMLSL